MTIETSGGGATAPAGDVGPGDGAPVVLFGGGIAVPVWVAPTAGTEVAGAATTAAETDESVEPAEPAETVEPAEMEDAAETVEPVVPLPAAATTQAVEATEAGVATEAVEPAEDVADSTEPTETVEESNEAIETVEAPLLDRPAGGDPAPVEDPGTRRTAASHQRGARAPGALRPSAPRPVTLAADDTGATHRIRASVALVTVILVASTGAALVVALTIAGIAVGLRRVAG